MTYELIPGTFHPIDFADGLRLDAASSAETPRATQTEKSLGRLCLQVEGKTRSPEIFLLDYGGLEDSNGLALKEGKLKIVSRLAERAAKLSGLEIDLAHPAGIVRTGPENKIDHARFAAISKQVRHNNINASVLNNFRNITAYEIFNYTPEEMYFLDDHNKPAKIPRYGNDYIEPVYSYTQIGEGRVSNSEEIRLNVPVMESVSTEIKGLPQEKLTDETLLLVHPEALIESFRLGASPQLLAKMVVAHNLVRDPSGQQRNVFKSLAYITHGTLNRFVKQIKI